MPKKVKSYNNESNPLVDKTIIDYGRFKETNIGVGVGWLIVLSIYLLYFNFKLSSTETWFDTAISSLINCFLVAAIILISDWIFRRK